MGDKCPSKSAQLHDMSLLPPPPPLSAASASCCLSPKLCLPSWDLCLSPGHHQLCWAPPLSQVPFPSMDFQHLQPDPPSVHWNHPVAKHSWDCQVQESQLKHLDEKLLVHNPWGVERCRKFRVQKWPEPGVWCPPKTLTPFLTSASLDVLALLSLLRLTSPTGWEGLSLIISRIMSHDLPSEKDWPFPFGSDLKFSEKMPDGPDLRDAFSPMAIRFTPVAVISPLNHRVEGADEEAPQKKGREKTGSRQVKFLFSQSNAKGWC